MGACTSTQSAEIKADADKKPLQDPKKMRGDFTKFQEAKLRREATMKERQIKLFSAANEMSGQVMEERERLSLGTRSRGTSRVSSRTASPTGNKNADKKPLQDPKKMRGDFTKFQEAKLRREATMKERQIKLFSAANEMSGQVMEERERLSLGTRSRGTSRVSSRTASPTGNKRQIKFKDEEVKNVVVTRLEEPSKEPDINQTNKKSTIQRKYSDLTEEDLEHTPHGSGRQSRRSSQDNSKRPKSKDSSRPKSKDSRESSKSKSKDTGIKREFSGVILTEEVSEMEDGKNKDNVTDETKLEEEKGKKRSKHKDHKKKKKRSSEVKENGMLSDGHVQGRENGQVVSRSDSKSELDNKRG